MAVESNNFYVIAILLLCLVISSKLFSWVFNKGEAKPNPLVSCVCIFSPFLSKFQVIAGNSDCLIVMIASGFQLSFKNCLY